MGRLLSPKLELLTLAALLLLLQAASGLPNAVPTGGRQRVLKEQVQQPSADELAARAAATKGLPASLLPGFHVTTRGDGWMNDPNAPMQHMGVYHLFFQWNPVGPEWAAPFWAHVASTDLVRWKELPTGLMPSSFYDFDGVFSGSATVLNNGTPAIMFTGTSRAAELGFAYQVQALASPVNASDPLLTYWVKEAAPSMPAAPPGGNHFQWRDPTDAVWVPAAEGPDGAGAGAYFFSVGAQLECQGGAALYRADADFRNFTFSGVLYSIAAASNNTAEGSCPAPEAGPPPGGQLQGEELVPCATSAQFSPGCPMWECPAFFQLSQEAAGGVAGISGFKYSDQVEGRQPFGRDWYVLSDQPVDFAAASPATATAEQPLFKGSVGGRFATPQLLDAGEVYASKTFRAADGRTIWWGWVYESPVGCSGTCGDGSAFVDVLGYQGAQALPREVRYDPASATLLLSPVREAETLRGQQLFSGDVKLQPGGQPAVLVAAADASPAGSQPRRQVGQSMESPAGAVQPLRQLEILALFNLTASGAFSVAASVELGGGARATATLNGTAADASGGGRAVTSADLWVDTRAAGGATQGALWGGPLALPPGGVPAAGLELRVLVDHSLLEVFALGGRQRAAVRVYPLDPSASWGASMLAGDDASAAAVQAAATVWEVDGCWVDELEPS